MLRRYENDSCRTAFEHIESDGAVVHLHRVEARHDAPALKSQNLLPTSTALNCIFAYNSDGCRQWLTATTTAIKEVESRIPFREVGRQ